MKTKNTENNYGTSTRNVQLLIDESFAEKVILANDSVRLLEQIVEEMDMKPIERALKRTGRKHRTNPVTMLKIVLYGAIERNYSSRPIEASCKRDMNYIWRLNGEPAPSERAICRFRSELLSECGEELFYGLVKRLKEVGEIRYEHLFVDGTKIEANANKYSFVWQKSASKYENRVLSKLETTVPALCEQYEIWPQNEEALLLWSCTHGAVKGYTGMESAKANQVLKAWLPTMSVRIVHCVLIKRAVPKQKEIARFKSPRTLSVNRKIPCAAAYFKRRDFITPPRCPVFQKETTRNTLRSNGFFL